MKCPLAFKLRYIDGVQTPPSPALFLGQRVHAGLENFYRHKMLGVDLPALLAVKTMFINWEEEAELSAVPFKTVNDAVALQEQASRLVTAYIAQVPPDEPRPIAVETRLQHELIDPITGENLGIPLLGIIDLVLDSPTTPVVVDFKTTARASTPLEISHEIQLSCYSYLFRHATGQRESGLEIRSLVKTKTPKIEKHEYPARSEQHSRRLFAVLREYLDCLDTGRFNYRPSWMCGMCDFQSHCQDWGG